jgi:uncharacterized membrane protein
VKEPKKKNWIFETIQIILIMISFIFFLPRKSMVRVRTSLLMLYDNDNNRI